MARVSDACRGRSPARICCFVACLVGCQSTTETFHTTPSAVSPAASVGVEGARGAAQAPALPSFGDCIDPQFRPDGPPHTCDEECAARGARCVEGGCDDTTIVVYGVRSGGASGDSCPDGRPRATCKNGEPWRDACLPGHEDVTAVVWACDRWLPASSDVPIDPPPFRRVRCCCGSG